MARVAQAWVAMAVFSLAGCALPVPPQQMHLPPFAADEHAAHFGAGGGAVRGQAFLRQRGGGVVTCAGAEVILMPATPYFREIVRQLTAGVHPSGAMPQAAKLLVSRSRCDAQGGFAFENLPRAKWLVLTEVRWQVGYRREGGALASEVDAPGEGIAQIVLSDDSFIGR